MSIAIAYASKYGSTRTVAETVAGIVRTRGRRQVTLLDLGSAKDPVLPDGDTVLLGAPVYAGAVLPAMTRFVDRYLSALLERQTAIFLSCLYTGARAENQLAESFPARLIVHSFGTYYVGGRVSVQSLRWFDRLVMKRVAGVSSDVDRTDSAEVDRMVRELVERTGA